MNSFDFFTTPKAPWVLLSFESIVYQNVPDNFLLLDLSGHNMTDLERMYREFSSIFQFPNYFGNNLNALDECLTDLEWLSAEGYLVTIKNAEFLLKNEPDETLFSLLSILNDVGGEWAKPVECGEAWDRSGLPFHTVLEVDESLASNFLNKLHECKIPRIRDLTSHVRLNP